MSSSDRLERIRPADVSSLCRMNPNPKIPYGRTLEIGTVTRMLGIRVRIFPCATPSGVSKKFLVSENSSSDPMPWAPPPPIAIAHARFVEGASPPNTLPKDPVNVACAAAEPWSAANAAVAATMTRVICKKMTSPTWILPPERSWMDGPRAASVLTRRVQRREVVQLPPLHWRDAPAVFTPAPLFFGGRIRRPPPLLSPPIPHDLHAGIVGEGAAEQFEGGKVATPHNDESGFEHMDH